MSDDVKQLIKGQADKIREELISSGFVSYLFGEPLDMMDADSVLVAAVSKARFEGIRGKCLTAEVVKLASNN